MANYTEGISSDGAVILEDGVPVTISKILYLLNKKDEIKEVFNNYPEIETISFDRNMDIVCKKKNGCTILCANLKELREELEA